MAQQPQIRWKDSDVKTLRNAVKAHNKEIDRVNKLKPSERYTENEIKRLQSLQPEKIDFKTLKRNIKSRKGVEGYDSVLSDIMSYLRYGGTRVVTGGKGLTVLKSEAEIVKKQTKVFNAKQRAKVKELGISPQKGTSTVEEQQFLKPKKFNLNKTQKEWDLFKRNLEKRLNDEQSAEKSFVYFLDYKSAVSNFLGKMGEEKINKYLDSKVTDFVKFFEKSLGDPILNIQFTSDPLPIEELVTKALGKWKTVYG